MQHDWRWENNRAGKFARYSRSIRLSRPGIILISNVIIFSLVFFPFSQESVYQSVYFACSLLCMLGVACPIIVHDADVGYCNPLTVISLVYVMLFAVCPMYDIVNKNYIWFGYNFFSSGLFATVVAIVGYLAFVVSYIFSSRRWERRGIMREAWSAKADNAAFVVGIMLVSSFMLMILYLVMKGGNSVLYSLSLGMLGDGGSDVSDASVEFLSNFSYCLPGLTLAYCEYGKSKVLKVASIYLMLAILISRGFRFIIFQIAIMFFCYYWIKKKKLPNIRVIFAGLLLLLVSSLFMTVFRNEIRSGAGADLSVLNLTTIAKAFDEMFWDNLRIYKNYYGMVGVIPESFPFSYLSVMLVGTAVMFIPRAIWPDKPVHLGPGLDELLGPNYRGTGQAYPNLGEYWYAFGAPAVVLFMCIYGWWMKRCVTLLGKSPEPVDHMAYAVLISVNLQLIIRGYTPSNFWLVIFSVVPLLILKPLCCFLSIKTGGNRYFNRL